MVGSTEEIFSLQPKSVQRDKLWVRKNQLHLLNTMSFDVPEEINKQANAILSDYLKRSRLALRLLGGDLEWPLYSVASAHKWRQQHKTFRTPGYHNNEVLKDVSLIKEMKHNCVIKDIILEKKIDIDSLSFVFREPAWGNQEWKNLAKRFKDRYKAEIVLGLMTKRYVI
jgi:hypothetical protein